MGKDPRQIRQEIERTRAELGNDLDLLNEKVNPARVMGRRVSATRTAVTGLRERVMGSASETGSAASDQLRGVASGAGDVASSVSGRVAATPELARRQAQGNPLAAGLIAFGVGWLASSMLPVTETEKQVGARLKDQASSHAEPVEERLSEAAQEVAGNLQPTVQDAVSSVKGAAADATSEVARAGPAIGPAGQGHRRVGGLARAGRDPVRCRAGQGTSTRSARRSTTPPKPNRRWGGTRPGRCHPHRGARSPGTRPDRGRGRRRRAGHRVPAGRIPGRAAQPGLPQSGDLRENAAGPGSKPRACSRVAPSPPCLQAPSRLGLNECCRLGLLAVPGLPTVATGTWYYRGTVRI